MRGIESIRSRTAQIAVIVIFAIVIFALGFFTGAVSNFFDRGRTDIYDGYDGEPDIERTADSPADWDGADGSVTDAADSGVRIDIDLAADFLPEDTLPEDDSPDEDSPDDSRQYISWQFFTYEEPDFKSLILDRFPPGEVHIIERRDDGWALMEIYGSRSWVYPGRNLYYIDRWVSLYSDVEDENASWVLSPQIVEVLDQDGNWIKIDTELGEKWVDIYSIRQTVLLDVPSYDQRALGYPLGCEVVALAMMMNFEHDVSVHDLALELPRADHPDEGFRGDPASSTRGWTIFPPALSGLMEKYLGSSLDLSGLEMEDLRVQLNENRPVLVWVNGLGWPVHALCLTGYDRSGFFYNDPWTGVKDTHITFDDFYEIWNNPVYDRVLDLTYSPRKALSY